MTETINLTLPALPALTGSPKQIVWAERIRQTEMIALMQRVAEVGQGIAPALADNPVEGETMIARINAFVAAQAAKTGASYWINDLRTEGSPRQQFNRAVDQWAADLQKDIESRIAAEQNRPQPDMTIDEIVEAIDAYKTTSLAYVGAERFTLRYVNAVEGVGPAYARACDNLDILYLGKGINPYHYDRYASGSPAERLEAAQQMRQHMGQGAK